MKTHFDIRDREGMSHSVMELDGEFFVRSEIMQIRSGEVFSTTKAYFGSFTSSAEAVDSIGEIITIQETPDSNEIPDIDD